VVYSSGSSGGEFTMPTEPEGPPAGLYRRLRSDQEALVNAQEEWRPVFVHADWISYLKTYTRPNLAKTDNEVAQVEGLRHSLRTPLRRPSTTVT
jgi:hypothetical protein